MNGISRRSVLSALSALSLNSAVTYVAGAAVAKEVSTGVLADSWMQRWISDWNSPSSRHPDGALYLGRFADKNPIYFLSQTIGWKPNPGQERYEEVMAPVGFVTDLASIPRIFWSLLRPDGNYAYAAIVHDYLYWTQTRSREDSDMILKLGMQDFNVKRSVIATIYEAVRAGGGGSWTENARLRNAGEKRILKRFPDDPRTLWTDWKTRPDTMA